MTQHSYKIRDQVRRTKTGIPHMQPAFPTFVEGHVFAIASVEETYVMDEFGNRHVLEFIEPVQAKPDLRTAIRNALCEIGGHLESRSQDTVDIIEQHIRQAI